MTWIYVMEDTALPEGGMAPVYPLGINVVLARVGGACPCSKSVRWVVDVPEGATGGDERLNP